jgi:hypothetical protein
VTDETYAAHESPDDATGYDPAALRLRFRARYAALALVLATVMPYEVIEGTPQFLWHMAGELGLAAFIATLTPALVGLAIVVAGYVIKRPISLAFFVLGALLAGALIIRLGAEAAAWETVIPASIGESPLLALLCLALTAAGAGLTFDTRTRRVGHGLLITAVVLATAFYLMPGRGEAPLTTAIRLLGQLNSVADWRFQLGFLILAILLLWPALIALAGLVHLRIPATDDQPMLGIVARYGLAIILGMLVYRSMAGGMEGWSTMTSIGVILCLTGFITVTAAAVEVAVPALLSPPPEGAGPTRPVAIRSGVISLGAVVVLALGQWGLARPPTKGVDWTLVAPTAAGDQLFGPTLDAWNSARYHWDAQARNQSGAEALLAVKAAARTLVEEARALDPALADAFERFTRESRDLGLAGRRWFRLIGDVNDAIRATGQPYYLDPTVITFTRDGGKTRHFRMRSFRVARVRRFDAEGDAYATLHVERLDEVQGDSSLLGFSRDRQPFAIVLLPEIRDFQEELAAGAVSKSCLEGTHGTPNEGEEDAASTCGDLLARMVSELGPGLNAAAAAVVDRHELQHQLDGPHVPMAGLVAERLTHRGVEVRERVNRELSAYLAQLTAPDAPPHLGVVHLARLTIGTRGRTVYPMTGLLALEALTGHTTLGDDGPDPQGLTLAMAALASMDADALRRLGADTWARLYGSELPEIKVEESAVP